MYQKIKVENFFNLYPTVHLKHNQVYQCNYNLIDNVTFPVVTVKFSIVIDYIFEIFFTLLKLNLHLGIYDGPFRLPSKENCMRLEFCDQCQRQ